MQLQVNTGLTGVVQTNQVSLTPMIEAPPGPVAPIPTTLDRDIRTTTLSNGIKVITEAMRIFARDIESSAERRRAVMKGYITLYGGISLYAAGVLDQPSEKALIAELSAMNARP